MRGLILALMSNVCYLAVILIFLVVTARYLVVTARYCSLRGGYWWLLLLTGRYWSFPLLVCTTENPYLEEHLPSAASEREALIFY